MAITIAFTSLKGGVGKSTFTLNVATCLHKAGHKALIVDADSQGTCRAWSTRASESEHEGPPVVGIDGKSLRRDLERVAKGFDVVVIDAPPRIGQEVRAAMLAADMVVLPVTPGGADVWALQETLTVLAEAREMRPELKAMVVVNRGDRTTLAKLTTQAVTDTDIPVLGFPIGNRVAFGEATLTGQGVVDYAPGSKAAEEIQELTKAILDGVGGKGSWRKRARR